MSLYYELSMISRIPGCQVWGGSVGVCVHTRCIGQTQHPSDQCTFFPVVCMFSVVGYVDHAFFFTFSSLLIDMCFFYILFLEVFSAFFCFLCPAQEGMQVLLGRAALFLGVLFFSVACLASWRLLGSVGCSQIFRAVGRSLNQVS